MQFTLIKNNNILLGPLPWNPKEFQVFIFNNGLNVSLQITEPKETVILGEFKLYPTIVTKVEPKFYEKIKVDFTIENNLAYYTETTELLAPPELEIALANKKIELKSNLSIERKKRQYAPIDVDLDGEVYMFAADAESQNAIINTESYMLKSDVVNWKLINGKFHTISKAYMTALIKLLYTRTQELFTKEKQLIEIIDSFSVEDMIHEKMVLDWGPYYAI